MANGLHHHHFHTFILAIPINPAKLMACLDWLLSIHRSNATAAGGLAAKGERMLNSVVGLGGNGMEWNRCLCESFAWILILFDKQMSQAAQLELYACELRLSMPMFCAWPFPLNTFAN